LKLSNSVKSISYLKQNTARAVQEVRECNDPLVITQNGEAKAVLLDIVEYERMKDALALLKMLAQSKESYSEGRHRPAGKAMADIRKQLGAKGY
jgi:prevent-host-death family protein